MVINKFLAFRKSDWSVVALGVVVLAALIGFGVYYYYDRYVHPDEDVIAQQAAHLEKQVLENPQNAELRVGVATFYLDKGRVDLAIQQAQEALKIEPKHQGAIMLLGVAYKRQGDLDAAIEQFNQLVDLNKDDPMAAASAQMELVNYYLGNLYNQQGKYQQAVDALLRALAIDRTDADAHYELGVAYQRLNDHDNALIHLERAVVFVPDFTEAYQAAAISYQALGKTAEAAYARAMVALNQGKASAAATQLEAVTIQAPDFMPAYLGLGLAYEKLGKRDQAIAAIQKYLASNPADMAAAQALGRLGVK